jgi:hypothetical protein
MVPNMSRAVRWPIVKGEGHGRDQADKRKENRESNHRWSIGSARTSLSALWLVMAKRERRVSRAIPTQPIRVRFTYRFADVA